MMKITLRGAVYNLASFAKVHPGGERVLKEAAELEDAWDVFAAAHGNAEEMLAGLAKQFLVQTNQIAKGGGPMSMQEMLKSNSNVPPREILRMSAEELADALNVFDVEAAARSRLPGALVTYISYGAEDEESVKANRNAWETFALRPRVARDVFRCSLACSLRFSKSDGSVLREIDLSRPIFIAPFAGARLAHPEGERALGQAAAEKNTLYSVPYYASFPLTELHPEERKQFFQLYVPTDLETGKPDYNHLSKVLDYVCDIGFMGVIITVDSPQFGNREKTYRSKEWLNALREECGGMARPAAFQNAEGIGPHPGNSQRLTWDDIAWIKDRCNSRHVPVLVKGIMTGEDALLAKRSGVQGVVISNHGGRQLDGTLGTAAVVEECVEALRGSYCLCFVDGGIRRGKDVFRALALGCHGVFLGRPILWGLGAGGREGVERIIELISDELLTVMQLCGTPTVSEISRSHVTVSHL